MMNEVLARIYETGAVEDAHGQSIPWAPTGTPRQTGLLLHQLVSEHKLERTIEVGMAYGLSTLAICQAHRDRGGGSHTAIDPVQSTRWQGIGVLNVERAGLQRFLKLIEMPSFRALPKLLEEGETLDFAFIDGAHLFDYALVDFFYVDRLLRTGGIVVFDDLWMPGVRRVIHFVLRNRAYEVLPVQDGSSLWTGAVRTARRYVQNPFERDRAGIRRTRAKCLALRKQKDDRRAWDFHRSF